MIRTLVLALALFGFPVATSAVAPPTAAASTPTPYMDASGDERQNDVGEVFWIWESAAGRYFCTYAGCRLI